MKKIIAAFDGLNYAENTEAYAVQIARQEKMHLFGIFLDDPTYTSYKIYDLITKEGVNNTKLKKLEAKDKATRTAAAENFESACRKSGLTYAIHHDHNTPILELKHESIYADLLVINAKETLTHYPEKVPTRFIRDLLTDTQCPVLLVQDTYQPINKIILLFDGEPTSVHAIKMFSYLLPHLKELETEVISVKPADTSLHVPDNKLMKEFMKRHYPHASYTIAKGWPEDEIVKRLKKQATGALVVLGAYKRGSVSRWLRESMADTLMKEIKLPLFIAHNK
ncbi:MAG: universal stress protein [Ferruginibacter sp.]|uniref:universal stress protein n=1 Tax=Ferruginibacter sp. TaxID=1940288 RepID=UPI0026596019|nr:universal stress protein [Ferruginibacter sp.]MDB5277502.1 universal stress protein [Ferruginibacter sp.]